MRDQAEFLIDHADSTGERLSNVLPLAVLAHEVNRAFVMGVNTCDDFDDRAFARAVFPYQAVDFSTIDFQVDVIQRLNAWKRL